MVFLFLLLYRCWITCKMIRKFDGFLFSLFFSFPFEANILCRFRNCIRFMSMMLVLCNVNEFCVWHTNHVHEIKLINHNPIHIFAFKILKMFFFSPNNQALNRVTVCVCVWVRASSTKAPHHIDIFIKAIKSFFFFVCPKKTFFSCCGEKKKRSLGLYIEVLCNIHPHSQVAQGARVKNGNV